MPDNSLLYIDKDRVQRRVDFGDVVAHYADRKAKRKIPSSGSATIQCLFHDDSDPSMSVNVDKGFYKCHACGASGDLFGFVMEQENCSFPEAIQTLAERYGIEPEEG